MRLTQYQVDAFAEKPFTGNPAAVCVLDYWLDDSLMQSIAAENNLSETAFSVLEDQVWHIRWFTPTSEVRLCGHATLATAHVLFNELGTDQEVLRFNSLSGPLSVSREKELLVLDFPSEKPLPREIPPGLPEALGGEIIECYWNQDYVLLMQKEESVTRLQPDFAALNKIDARGIIVTADSDRYDFVNRFFGPRVGVNEDPVTGSAFTKLIPFWSEKLSRTELLAKQVSVRGGEVKCRYLGDRVTIAGQAVLFSTGEIYV